jgi:hypothetical protein
MEVFIVLAVALISYTTRFCVGTDVCSPSKLFGNQPYASRSDSFGDFLSLYLLLRVCVTCVLFFYLSKLCYLYSTH